jgi:hypothetical protein
MQLAEPPRAADTRALRLRPGLRAQDRRPPGGANVIPVPRAHATHGLRHSPAPASPRPPAHRPEPTHGLAGPCTRDPQPASACATTRIPSGPERSGIHVVHARPPAAPAVASPFARPPARAPHGPRTGPDGGRDTSAPVGPRISGPPRSRTDTALDSCPLRARTSGADRSQQGNHGHGQTLSQARPSMEGTAKCFASRGSSHQVHARAPLPHARPRGKRLATRRVGRRAVRQNAVHGRRHRSGDHRR